MRSPPLPATWLLALLVFAAACPSDGESPSSAVWSSSTTSSSAALSVAPVGADRARGVRSTDKNKNERGRHPGRAARLIVKLRGPLGQAVARSARPDGGAVDAAREPQVAALLARHAGKSLAPLYRARARQQAAGLSPAQAAARLRQRFPARAARAAAGARVPELDAVYILELDPRNGPAMDATIAALRADPDVVYVERDEIASASFVPNDPSYATSGSWGQPYDDLYGLKKVGTTAAWDTSRGRGVVVAVIDSGLDYNHPDLDGSVWSKPAEIPGNGADDDGNGLIDDHRGYDFVGANASTPSPDADPMDVHGHGTHVAGTVAAEGDNGLGVVGVAFAARVLPVRALDDAGFGPDSALANAIVYAVDEGADIINASWGHELPSTTLEDAVNYAAANGVLFVAAAGNSARDTSGFTPAGFANALAVSALTPTDTLAEFSNHGSKIELAAPGVDILSLRAGTTDYVRFDGTSMAAPHVSGVAALVLSARPSFTVDQLWQVLTATASDLGPPGKDPSFGYGRVNAAAAVTIEQTLAARISTPSSGSVIAGPTAIAGSASGTGFVRYVLDRRRQGTSDPFTTLRESTSPVSNAELGVFDDLVPDGAYTVRLRAFHSGGSVFTHEITLTVRHGEITTPRPPRVPSMMAVRAAAQAMEISGRATGPQFQQFRLEWAAGMPATGAYSTAGVVLEGGGTTQVTDGLLARWTPPATLKGAVTLRLIIVNAGFQSETTSAVYLEPDLLPGQWPVLHGNGSGLGPIPFRISDGTQQLLICPGAQGGSCSAYGADGWSPGGLGVTVGSVYTPSAGNLDPTRAGDEVVMLDSNYIRIFTGDFFFHLRDIILPLEDNVQFDQLRLADLDSDGTHEIMVPARRGNLAEPHLGRLYVLRADGQPFSSRYPLDLSSPVTPGTQLGADALAVDLNRDGRKEILVTVLAGDGESYSLLAYNADGTAFAGWTRPTFTAKNAVSKVADLDHDGNPEIVVSELADADNWLGRVRVVDHTGVTRAGWPIDAGRFVGAAFAIGDLDRDQREELVVADGDQLMVFRHDGLPLAPWPRAGNYHAPLVADIDGNGLPDIVVSSQTIAGFSGLAYRDQKVQAFSLTGGLLREWQVFGMNGQQPFIPVTSAGDFNADGKTDLAVHIPLIAGGSTGGWIVETALTLLTSGASFSRGAADWPIPSYDAQNSDLRDGRVRLAPVADATVRDGTSAGSNFGSAKTLEVKNSASAGTNRVSYLRFALTDVRGAVRSAKLRVSGNRVTTGGTTDSAFAVASSTWAETGITWNNRPALGARQGTGVVVGAVNKYHEWDVTSFVAAQKTAGATTVSLALMMDAAVSHGPDTFSAREGASPPELVVDTNPASVPTLVNPPRATPSPVTGTSASLSVLGADDGGEAALVYTWSVVGTPPAPVGFSVNGTNAAKNATATFSASGSYQLAVVARDAGGATASGRLLFTVNATPTSVVVAPASVTVAPGGTVSFNAHVRDQFGTIIASQPIPTWAVSGGGTIVANGSSGRFTAGSAPGGPFTVTATMLGVNGTAQVTISGGTSSTVTLGAAADAYVRDGTSASTNFGADPSLPVKASSSAGSNRVSYLRFNLGTVTGTVTAARLRLYGSRPTAGSITDSAFAVASNTWVESTINWNNRPALGAQQGSAVTITTTARYYEWDVTAFVQAQKAAGASAASFAMRMNANTSAGPDVFNSKEASSNRPELVVTSSP